jgi:hypothetical protein
MRSPFRNDEEAAGRTVEELWVRYENLARGLGRAEADIGRAHVARWIWTLRLVILGLTFALAYFAGYYTSADGNVNDCNLAEGSLG